LRARPAAQDEDVRAGEGLGEPARRDWGHGGVGQREFLGPPGAGVDVDCSGVAAGEFGHDDTGKVTGADDEDALAPNRAVVLLDEVEADRGQRAPGGPEIGVLGDRLGGLQGVLEQAPEHRSSGVLCGGEGGPDLARDLGFPHDHRIEPAGHREEVFGDAVARVHLHGVDDPGPVGQALPHRSQGALDPAVEAWRIEVKLEAVARREQDVAGDAGPVRGVFGGSCLRCCADTLHRGCRVAGLRWGCRPVRSR
jgi:hypothetical protein